MQIVLLFHPQKFASVQVQGVSKNAGKYSNEILQIKTI
jgi:hypothetical protein